jgi:hypothetical protein
VEKVLEADPAALLALPGFDQDTIDAVVAAARTEQAARAASVEASVAEPGEPVDEPADENADTATTTTPGE